MPFFGFGYQIYLVDNEFGDVLNGPDHAPGLPLGIVSSAEMRDVLINVLGACLSLRNSDTISMSSSFSGISMRTRRQQAGDWALSSANMAMKLLRTNCYRNFVLNSRRVLLIVSPLKQQIQKSTNTEEYDHQTTLVILHYIDGVKRKIDIDNKSRGSHIT